jgi:serine/threonine protein kinase
VRDGDLHMPMPWGQVGVGVASTVEVLPDVAGAVQYLHSVKLVHGDIKVRLRFDRGLTAAQPWSERCSARVRPPAPSTMRASPPRLTPPHPNPHPQLENVLLKSDPSRRLGVTPKLADFGLSRILDDSDATINVSGAGTLTHLAPEMFEAGSRVTAAVDAYAFGGWRGGRAAGRAACGAAFAPTRTGALAPCTPLR